MKKAISKLLGKTSFLFFLICITHLISSSDTLFAEVSIPVNTSTSATTNSIIAIEPEVAAETVIEGNVTLDFQNADIRNVLRIIALKSGVNIVAGNEVSGPVTISLKNVPWEKALDIVLKTYSYAYEKDGSVIRVTTLDSLALEALETRVFPLTYANAEEVQATLQEMLSERGSIRADVRTNLLIVTDIPTNLYKIEKVLERLDRGTPQVLIEAKIVEMSTSEAERLGVKWNAALALSGSSRPTTFPWTADTSPGDFNQFLPRGKPQGSIIPVADDGTTTGSVVIETPDDFPTLIRRHDDGSPKGSPAALFPFANVTDFSFGKIDFSNFQILLELIKENSNTNILSEPKITVLSNQDAKILVGEELYIPIYERNGETGQMEITGYELRSLGIELNVTPKINQKNQVTLQLAPSISSLVGFEELSPGISVPRIAIRNASTTVRVANRETVVLGGLIKENTVDEKVKFPLLGDLPVLNKFFSHTNKTVTKTELMFFITVTVLEEQDMIGVFDETTTS